MGVHGLIAANVDIISMSLTLKETNRKLEEAILKARNRSIIIICSTADEGQNVDKVWPAPYDNETLSMLPVTSTETLLNIAVIRLDTGFRETRLWQVFSFQRIPPLRYSEALKQRPLQQVFVLDCGLPSNTCRKPRRDSENRYLALCPKNNRALV